MGRLFLAVALLASTAGAQTTAPTTSPSIDKLLRDLAADEFATRQRAAGELAAMGKEAIPQLEELLKQSKNEEVRTSLETAISKIRESEASGPTLITANFSAGTAQQVFEELSRQAGVEIEITGGDGWDRFVETRDLSFSRKPFWAALSEACDAFGVGFNMANRKIQLTQGGRAPRFRALAGPLLVVADTISRTSSSIRQLNDVEGQPRSNTNLTLQLRVFCEPRATVHSIQCTIDEARDEQGKDLRHINAQAAPHPGMVNIGGRNDLRMMPVHLVVTEKPGTHIARLSGKVNVQLVSKSHLLEIPDVQNAEPSEHVIPGGKLRFEKLEGRRNQFTMRVTCESTNNINASMLQDVRLVDAEGRGLMNAGRSSTSSNRNKIEIDLRFHAAPEMNIAAPNQRGEMPGPPAKLILRIPIETRDIEAPFEFKDIPMP